MDFIWFFVAMPVVSFLCTAYLIAKDHRRKLPDCVVPLSTSNSWSARKTFKSSLARARDQVDLDGGVRGYNPHLQ